MKTDFQKCRNVLVRATNWVGDAVMTLPALQELRRALPRARITLLVRPWVSAVFEREGVCDRILPYPAAGHPNAGWRETAEALRAEKFDAAVLLQNAFEAALIARWARIPIRAGYARDARSGLLTDAVPVPRRGEIPEHECYYYLELLRRIGIIRYVPYVEHIVLSNPPSRAAGRQKLIEAGMPGAAGPVVAMSPGAAFGTAKRWPADRYVEVGRELAAGGARIGLFGASSESALCQQVAAGIGEAAFSTAGKTSLADFLTLIAGCDLFVTNDSGAMHLAAAARVPVVAVFGPTDEKGTAPLGPDVRIIKRPVPCSPCKLRHCPIDHRCMERVSTAEVLEAAREALKRSGTRV